MLGAKAHEFRASGPGLQSPRAPGIRGSSSLEIQGPMAPGLQDPGLLDGRVPVPQSQDPRPSAPQSSSAPWLGPQVSHKII